MKKFLYIISLAAGLILAASCADLMETSPTDEMDKDLILHSEDGLEVALDGIYASFYNRLDFVTANAHQCFGLMAVLLSAELMGDDMVQTAQGAGWFWKDYNYEVRSRYTSKIWRCYFTWKYFYEIISNANYVIAAVPGAEGDKAALDNILAQALSLRAYSYFMLVQSFQQTYIGHEDLPGVPLYTEPSLTSSKGKGRGTVSEVYDQICRDLDKALDIFRNSTIERSHVSHLDLYSTSLIRARVAMVMNDWPCAEKNALAAAGRPGCSLLGIEEATVTKGSFDPLTKNWTTGRTPFNNVSSTDVLWGAEIVPEQSTVYASFYSNMDACTDVYYAAEAPKCISNWLYSQIPDSDVRKGWWNGDIGVSTAEWKYGGHINYNQHKFQWADQKALKGDYIFMRMEEAYLILAESRCRMKEYDDARAALSELMSRRDPEYADALTHLTDSEEQTFGTVGTVTTLMDMILLQRRIELWGETGRIFDILRLAKGWTRYWEVDGEQSNHTNYLSKFPEYLNFPPDYLECILMIPQTEIDNNPLINAGDQNPYIQ